jgi:type II secretory pathway component GspD/PulD (secretin)
MAISGLIKEKQEEDVTRVPWLSEIPVIGGAFRKKTTMTGGGSGERGNTELFVMLTPSIVSTKEGSVKKEAKQIIEEKDVVSKKPAVSHEPVIPGPVGHYTRVYSETDIWIT